jgi:hypothetical protein
MTAAFSQRDEFVIEAEAWKSHGVGPLPAQTMLKQSKAERKQRTAKREAISRTVTKGLEVLESNNPPRSREEAIRRIVGAGLMLVAFLFPQYRLAIQVAGWLWDYVHGDPSAGVQQ